MVSTLFPKGLTGAELKKTAMFLMLIDHIGAVLVEYNGLNVFALEDTVPSALWTQAAGFDFLLRCIGRLAFPIFCFLLVEGFRHTHSRKRYCLNLAVFALISEIPFDLAVSRVPFAQGSQNIFFTLATGVAVLMALEAVRGRPLVSFLIIAAGFAIATLLDFDYYGSGILMICCFYYFQNHPQKLMLSLTGVCLTLGISELPALLALPLIRRYNGQRGEIQHKYGFYFFYPAHLLVLYLISSALPVLSL